MDKLVEALNNFNKIWSDYRKFGTYDSEPRWVKRYIFEKALENENPVFPQNASDWQIYASMKGAEEAANNLTNAIKEVVNNLLNLTVGDFKKVKNNNLFNL